MSKSATETTCAVLAVMIISLALIACSSEPAPSPPADSTTGAEKDEAYNELLANHEMGPHETESVDSFLKATYPDWTVAGVATTFQKKGFDCLTVDLKRNTESKTVNIVARVFTHQDETYWKTEPVTPELEQVIRILAIAKKPGD